MSSEIVLARKKPIEVYAIKWTGENFNDVARFTEGNVTGAWVPGILLEVYDYLHDSWIVANLGDYIIRGNQREYYPHEGELFLKNYDILERY